MALPVIKEKNAKCWYKGYVERKTTSTSDFWMKEPSRNSLRMASQIKRYLSTVILTESREKVLHWVTILEVKLSKDLSSIKVIYTYQEGAASAKSIVEAIKRASPYLRNRLFKGLNLRRSPNLVFIEDKTEESASRIESILKDLHGT